MRKVNKHKQILDAASRVFLEKGFEKSTVERIAVEAKVGKGTIYGYFDSKENLFIEMIKAGVTYVYNDLYQVFEQGKSMEEVKHRFLQSALQLIHEHGDKLKILYEDSLTKMPMDFEEWLLEKNDWLVSKMAETLQQFMEQGQIRQVGPDILAVMLMNIIQIGFYYKVLKEEQNVEHVLKTQIDVIFNGVRVID